MTKEQAQSFYAEHANKSFFAGLVEFMTSGPIWALALAKVDAIKGWRAMMGPTNVFKARDEAPRRCERCRWGAIGLLKLKRSGTCIHRHSALLLAWRELRQCACCLPPLLR